MVRSEFMNRASTGKQSQGFTLIELLVVVVLLGILSGIAVFAVGNARDKAVAQACKSQQAQLLKAIDLYYIDNGGNWPKLAGTAYRASSTAVPTGEWSNTELESALVPEYLKQLPPYGTDSTTDNDFVLKAKMVKPSGKSAYVEISSNISSCAKMPTPITAP